MDKIILYKFNVDILKAGIITKVNQVDKREYHTNYFIFSKAGWLYVDVPYTYSNQKSV